MRTSVMLLFLAAAGLSSCAHDPRGSGGPPSPPARHVPVKVDGNQIAVEEVTRVARGVNAVSWVLDPKDAAGYFFDGDAVRFEVVASPPKDIGCVRLSDQLQEYLACRPEDDGRRFTCTRWPRPPNATCLKYTLTLQPRQMGGKPIRRPLDPKDPWIANE